MRILSRLTLAAATLAASGLLVPVIANAREIGVEPVSWSFLMVTCTNAGGDYGAVGSIYWCTVKNCDGKGGDCKIACSDEGGLETCTGSVPLLVGDAQKNIRKQLRLLGTRFLPASQGDTGTPNHATPAAAAAAPAASITVIY